MADTHGEIGHGWIGVDLDGTLAYYDEWKGPDYIGRPIIPMVQRVKKWLTEGKQVKIMTARAYPQGRNTDIAIEAIKKWSRTYIGEELEITYQKDYKMLELWDDRCVQVIPNTGQRADGRAI